MAAAPALLRRTRSLPTRIQFGRERRNRRRLRAGKISATARLYLHASREHEILFHWDRDRVGRPIPLGLRDAISDQHRPVVRKHLQPLLKHLDLAGRRARSPATGAPPRPDGIRIRRGCGLHGCINALHRIVLCARLTCGSKQKQKHQRPCHPRAHPQEPCAKAQ